MKVSWTQDHKMKWKEKISMTLKKKQKVLELVDFLLRKYKEYGIELQKLIHLEKNTYGKKSPFRSYIIPMM